MSAPTKKHGFKLIRNLPDDLDFADRHPTQFRAVRKIVSRVIEDICELLVEGDRRSAAQMIEQLRGCLK